MSRLLLQEIHRSTETKGRERESGRTVKIDLPVAYLLDEAIPREHGHAHPLQHGFGVDIEVDLNFGQPSSLNVGSRFLVHSDPHRRLIIKQPAVTIDKLRTW